jgi:hypothetical protein
MIQRYEKNPALWGGTEHRLRFRALPERHGPPRAEPVQGVLRHLPGATRRVHRPSEHRSGGGYLRVPVWKETIKRGHDTL